VRNLQLLLSEYGMHMEPMGHQNIWKPGE
jgi:hypothetical protein